MSTRAKGTYTVTDPPAPTDWTPEAMATFGGGVFGDVCSRRVGGAGGYYIERRVRIMRGGEVIDTWTAPSRERAAREMDEFGRLAARAVAP